MRPFAHSVLISVLVLLSQSSRLTQDLRQRTLYNGETTADGEDLSKTVEGVSESTPSELGNETSAAVESTPLSTNLADRNNDNSTTERNQQEPANPLLPGSSETPNVTGFTSLPEKTEISHLNSTENFKTDSTASVGNINPTLADGISISSPAMNASESNETAQRPTSEDEGLKGAMSTVEGTVVPGDNASVPSENEVTSVMSSTTSPVNEGTQNPEQPVAPQTNSPSEELNRTPSNISASDSEISVSFGASETTEANAGDITSSNDELSQEGAQQNVTSQLLSTTGSFAPVSDHPPLTQGPSADDNSTTSQPLDAITVTDPFSNETLSNNPFPSDEVKSTPASTGNQTYTESIQSTNETATESEIPISTPEPPESNDTQTFLTSDQVADSTNSNGQTSSPVINVPPHSGLTTVSSPLEPETNTSESLAESGEITQSSDLAAQGTDISVTDVITSGSQDRQDEQTNHSEIINATTESASTNITPGSNDDTPTERPISSETITYESTFAVPGETDHTVSEIPEEVTQKPVSVTSETLTTRVPEDVISSLASDVSGTPEAVTDVTFDPSTDETSASSDDIHLDGVTTIPDLNFTEPTKVPGNDSATGTDGSVPGTQEPDASTRPTEMTNVDGTSPSLSGETTQQDLSDGTSGIPEKESSPGTQEPNASTQPTEMTDVGGASPSLSGETTQQAPSDGTSSKPEEGVSTTSDVQNTPQEATTGNATSEQILTDSAVTTRAPTESPSTLVTVTDQEVVSIATSIPTQANGLSSESAVTSQTEVSNTPVASEVPVESTEIPDSAVNSTTIPVDVTTIHPDRVTTSLPAVITDMQPSTKLTTTRQPIPSITTMQILPNTTLKKRKDDDDDDDSDDDEDEKKRKKNKKSSDSDDDDDDSDDEEEKKRKKNSRKQKKRNSDSDSSASDSEN